MKTNLKKTFFQKDCFRKRPKLNNCHDPKQQKSYLTKQKYGRLSDGRNTAEPSMIIAKFDQNNYLFDPFLNKTTKS